MNRKWFKTQQTNYEVQWTQKQLNAGCSGYALEL
jgi:hypothetical protein